MGDQPMKTAKNSGFYKDMPFDSILSCVHCGLCLDACPTYAELGTEQDSPRGRLYLMRGLWEGELEAVPEVLAPLDRCIDCRACESACPAGVPYGELIEKTRGAQRAVAKPGLPERLLRGLVLNRILASTSGLVWLSRLTRMAEMLALDKLSQPLLPPFLRRAHSLRPTFGKGSFKLERSGTHAAAKPDAPRVALFTGCIMDVAEQQIHEATLQLLRLAGLEVVIPRDQGCCGALHVHNGERVRARQLAEANLTALADVDAVVVNAAGCGAQLKEYHHLFAETGVADPRFHQLAGKVVDLLDYLSRIDGFADHFDAGGQTVLYDAPCHLQHAQRIESGPRSLLAAVPGLQLAPLSQADRCCGAGGIYNLLQADLADAVLDRKLDDIELSMKRQPDARTLLTANPGCLLQIRHGIRRRGLALEVLHPADWLVRNLRITEQTP